MNNEDPKLNNSRFVASVSLTATLIGAISVIASFGISTTGLRNLVGDGSTSKPSHSSSGAVSPGPKEVIRLTDIQPTDVDNSFYKVGDAAMTDRRYAYSFKFQLGSSGASNSLTFSIDRHYRTLKGVFGIDDSTPDVRPGATLSLYGDSRLLAEATVFHGRPKTMNIDVRDVHFLTLKVRVSDKKTSCCTTAVFAQPVLIP